MAGGLKYNVTGEPCCIEAGAPVTAPIISLVIPAYNEERRLPETLPQVLRFFQEQEIPWEVIIADDGSTDHTAAIVEEHRRSEPRLRLLRLAHGGKGHAVRSGMLAAEGRFCFLSDADLSVPITDLPRFLPALEQAEVAIASREAAGAIRYAEPAYRHLMGRIYNLLVRLVLLPGIQDTQCGFKGFRRETIPPLFSRQGMEGWGFDVELLYRARQLGYRTVEVPVHWTYGQHSRLHPLRDSWRMAWDLLRVRWQAWAGYYRPR
jgi:dolichyl-phosphate beta-glucosyltransferase